MTLPTSRASLVLVATSLVILLAGTSYLPLLDRDEPRFARATVEMMQRGDWVVPWFNDGYRFDKPPLTYWMMAAGYRIFGVNELGARIHSIVTSTLAALLIFLFGRRLFTPAVGFAAALAWATCFQVFLHGRLALADMPMVLAVLLAHMALWELLFAERVPRFGTWFWVLWVALAGGFLAKGPIAVITPAITALLTRALLGRRSLPWRRLQMAAGLPIALAIVGAWGIPALLRTQGAFWDVGIGEHVVRRGVVAFNDRPIVPFYYLVTIFLSLFPWSANLGQLAVELRNNWRDDKNKFLLAWVAGPFLIFSFYSTQLPHYTLPAFPAILLLTFRSGLDPRLFPTWSRRLYWGLHGFFALLFVAVALYAGLLTMPEPLVGLQAALVALALAMLALQATALLMVRAVRDPEAGRMVPVYATVLLAAIATVVFAASIRPVSAPVRIRDALAAIPRDAPHVARGYAEPSLVFYADAFWDFDGPGPSRQDLEEPGPVVFLFRLGERGLDRLFRPGATDPFAESSIDEAARNAGVPSWLIDSPLQRARFQGFNFARSTWTDLAIFYRPVASGCAELTGAAEIARLLALDQDGFDQDLDGGWRPLADAGCYAEAAEIIDAWVAARPELDADNPDRVILRFHAAQMYAFADLRPQALERLAESYQPEAIVRLLEQQGESEILIGFAAWHAYVDATAAFLRDDREALAQARSRVAEGPAMPDGEVMNLAVVDRLIEGVGRSYAEAYGGQR